MNDVAEKGIKFIQDYKNILIKNETEKQFVLQIVATDRKSTQLQLNSLLGINNVHFSFIFDVLNS